MLDVAKIPGIKTFCGFRWRWRQVPRHLLVGTLLWLGAAPALGQDARQLEQQLQQVTQRIAELQRAVRQDTAAQDSVLEQLRQVELEIGQISRQLRDIQRNMAQQQQRLEQLQGQARQTEAGLRAEKAGLGGQLRTAYALGRQPLFKMLLNSADLGAMGRSLQYFRIYNRARLRQIDRLHQQLLTLQDIRRQVEAAQAALDADREQLSARRTARDQQLTQRRAVMAQLQQRIGDSRSELVVLTEDRNRLKTLLRRLRDLFADIPGELGAEQLFSALKGRLAWPVAGAVALAPGRTKPGGMDTQGTLIAAPQGSEVAAISHGRIAFADWLRGFGLITIVDHGEGYMSLYAFNESLFKEVGDWVQAGEPIASVGESGGRDRPGLYFELRRGGNPISLQGWFRSDRPDTP